jgi:L-lysine 6-transaminase
VRAQRSLEIIREESLLDNAAQVGAYLLQTLEHLSASFPDLLSNPRGRGLMCAVDLPDTELRNAVQDAAFESGLVLPICGSRSIRFRPALTFSRAEVDQMASIFQDAVKIVQANRT